MSELTNLVQRLHLQLESSNAKENALAKLVSVLVENANGSGFEIANAIQYTISGDDKEAARAFMDIARKGTEEEKGVAFAIAKILDPDSTGGYQT